MSNLDIIKELRTDPEPERRRELLAALYSQNLGIIRQVVRPYFRAGAEIDDCLQESFFGLVRAAELYDETAGKWAPYLAGWVRQTVGRAFMNGGNVKRLPVYLQNQIRNYSRAVADFKAQHGREPTDKELSAALGLSPIQLDRTRAAMWAGRVVSLSQPVEGSEDLTIADTIRDPADHIADALEEISNAEEAATLWGAVGTLDPEKADTIRARYRDGLTLREIADARGVSISAIRQRERAALARLRMNRDVRRLWEGYSSIIFHGGLSLFRRYGSAVEMAAIKHLEGDYQS